MAAKSLRPLPNDHKPMSEETRVRMRYVDLIVRPEARENARLRPAVMRSLRETFHGEDFIEVEVVMRSSSRHLRLRTVVSRTFLVIA